ncbi:hypothetical protein [Phenylobacterium sp. J367]|nr:hypothetical protein [Phenylobacterium sp. J367]MCR5878321.1 hypothetical protein [Phenylobacterium sp. J367]
MDRAGIEALYQQAHRLREADQLEPAIDAYGQVAAAAPGCRNRTTGSA